MLQGARASASPSVPRCELQADMSADCLQTRADQDLCVMQRDERQEVDVLQAVSYDVQYDRVCQVET